MYKQPSKILHHSSSCKGTSLLRGAAALYKYSTGVCSVHPGFKSRAAQKSVPLVHSLSTLTIVAIRQVQPLESTPLLSDAVQRVLSKSLIG